MERRVTTGGVNKKMETGEIGVEIQKPVGQEK